MDLALKGKVVLITGASRGIGAGIAQAFAAEGSKLAICARTEEPLLQAKKQLEESGAEVLAIPADISKPEHASLLVDQTVSHFGRLDVLVNNAGGNRRGNFEETSDDDWEEILNLNLKAHIRVSRGAIPEIKKQNAGAIIFISSIFGREAGGKGLSIYNTTKAGMNSLSKIMAMELAADKIRVNAVAPGSIRFPGGSWDRRCIADPEGMAEFIKREMPLGRFGTVEEVANVVTFLASERASLVTGTCINVDGCQSRSLI
ncbi:MAG: SDR family oxidoreductase [Deferribacteres bacterium]|nr:SDR family oxidoreductase [candidate division KSB1 bacterium]MCB9510375.1 SDR family oxidoreductase [Deferribacteres bacterium]